MSFTTLTGVAADADVSDLVALSGVAANSTDLGTFPGSTITDNADVKTALSELEAAIGAATGSTDLAIGTSNGTTLEVTSSTGNNVSLPLATTTVAGAMSSATFDDLSDVITLSGVAGNSADLGTFTGTTIADNLTIKAAIQAMETAVEAITADGNHTPVVRANATAGVAPTAGEVAGPINGDTASVYLNDGVKEVWAHNGTAWALAYTRPADAAVDLAVANRTATTLDVTNTDGSDATLPEASTTQAGLLNATDKITVDRLEQIRVESAAYTVLTTDNHILVDSSAGAVSITLPTAASSTGLDFTIKDLAGTSATNNITVLTPGAETIDGATTELINRNFDARKIVSDGTNFYRV